MGVASFSAVVLERGVVFRMLILRRVKETWKTRGTGTLRPELSSSSFFIDPDFRKSAAPLLLFARFV